MLDKTKQQKKAMIQALEQSLGIVSNAVKIVGIGRATHYLWMNEDPEYRAEVKAIDDLAIDFAESSLHKQIKEGNPTSTIFYLKTKGKSRGYVERQEIEHHADKSFKVTIVGDSNE